MKKPPGYDPTLIITAIKKAVPDVEKLMSPYDQDSADTLGMALELWIAAKKTPVLHNPGIVEHFKQNFSELLQGFSTEEKENITHSVEAVIDSKIKWESKIKTLFSRMR